jgi:uncharacterized membrane protein YhaH (DUF805 family)
MDYLKNLLFSCKGRLSRVNFFVGSIIVFLSVPIILGFILGMFNVKEFSHYWMGNSYEFNLRLSIMIVFWLIAFIPICIKRLHDLNKPWWLIFVWYFSIFLNVVSYLILLSGFFGGGFMSSNNLLYMIFLIALLIPTIFVYTIFFFLFFKKGTEGDNQYGPDPREGKKSTALVV